VPSNNYGYIEDLHMMFGHMVTAYIRKVSTLGQEPLVLAEMAMEKHGHHYRSPDR
jgi:hypothetical protein